MCGLRFSWRPLLKGHGLMAVAALALSLGVQARTERVGAAHVDTEWNQWLGGPGRTLKAHTAFNRDAPPSFTESWRRTLGSGFAGLSVYGTNALTAMTDGKQDVALLLDSGTGAERWRFPLGRTRKRAEGVPLGPLSTPALDAESAYVQALDGRFVCVELATGELRWELNLKRSFKAHEPGYGFAGSPLLWDDLVVLQPAGTSSASVVALNRRTGETRWQAALGTPAEYASASAWTGPEGPQVLVQLGAKVAGIDLKDGRALWQHEDVPGGLWTASVLPGGTVFFPTAGQTHLLQPAPGGAQVLWSSPVFESTMGPVVEVDGVLVGHHERRLTGLDAATGALLWQLPGETDGQLLALGRWLVFVNDRAGVLQVFSVSRQSCTAVYQMPVLKPTRMETPLTFAHGMLYIRSPGELVALRAEWGKGPKQ